MEYFKLNLQHRILKTASAKICPSLKVYLWMGKWFLWPYNSANSFPWPNLWRHEMLTLWLLMGAIISMLILHPSMERCWLANSIDDRDHIGGATKYMASHNVDESYRTDCKQAQLCYSAPAIPQGGSRPSSIQDSTHRNNPHFRPVLGVFPGTDWTRKWNW